MIGNETTGIYFSIGNLIKIKRLRVRRVGSRFIGMLICHDNGSVDVLGQWDDEENNSPSSSISELYDRSHGILTSITFSCSGSYSGSFVNGIFVGIDYTEFSGPFPGDYQVFTIENMKEVCPYLPSLQKSVLTSEQPVVSWWFSACYDHVEPWDGEYQEINVSRRSYYTLDVK